MTESMETIMRQTLRDTLAIHEEVDGGLDEIIESVSHHCSPPGQIKLLAYCFPTLI